MKYILTLWLLFLISASACGYPAVKPQSKPVIFTHVTVIDTTGAPAKSNMTVVINGDRIVDIGKTGHIQIPKDARVVDATGKFLIPGLWDMHIHWYDPEYLPLFVANGVTGARLMWGLSLHHEWREDIEAGKLIGPRLVIASPIIDGPKPIWPGSVAVSNEAEARKAVKTAKQEGADFIKVYSLLSREAFFAIADESKKQGIAFAGHIPQSITVAEAAEAGQRSVEHLTGILTACSAKEDELRKTQDIAGASSAHGKGTADPAAMRQLTYLVIESYDAKKAAGLFAKLKQHHTWQCPTLTVLRSIAFLTDPEFRNDPRLKYMPAAMRTRWDPANDFRFKARTAEDYELSKLVLQRQFEIVGQMRKAGVEFLAGTDTLNPYCFPGFSLHDELELMVKAGFTPLEALQSATLNPARYLGQEKDLGTVEKGKAADLVLLDANPLEDIKNTQKINAVVCGGKLYSRADLDRMLATVEATAKKQ